MKIYEFGGLKGDTKFERFCGMYNYSDGID